MIKDREQKRLAAHYCAVQGMLPFLEVIVRSPASIDESPVDITDIDVFGIAVSRLNGVRRTIFDCKTAHRPNGINRALWVSGLRQFVKAESAFVIQTKKVPNTHRLAALAMGVRIHTEDSFRQYATSLNPEFPKDITYLDDMDQWDAMFGIRGSSVALSELIFFASTQTALELSGARGVRQCIGQLSRAAGELDPGKQLHQMLFGCAVSSFLLHMAIVIAVLKDVFEFNTGRSEFEQRVRYFLWEGRENYELRFKLWRALATRGEGDNEQEKFELPEWNKLVELVRSYLDAPEALVKLSLVVKEIAFAGAAPVAKPIANRNIGALLSRNNRGRQFIFAGAEYLVRAAHLPHEFQKKLEICTNSFLA